MTEAEKAAELITDHKKILYGEIINTNVSFDITAIRCSLYFCNQAICLEKRDKIIWWLQVIKILQDELNRLERLIA